MPRSGTFPFSYSYPAGTPGISGQTISSSAYNNYISDVQVTFNTVLPLNYGGTGASTQIAGWNALSMQGTTIPSSGTINLSAATGPLIDISGTTTVTAVTLTNGLWRIARATGAFLLTASSSLIVNGSTTVNYTTKVNDLLIFATEGGNTNVWIVGAAVNTFLDSVFRVQNVTDPTKQWGLSLAGITTGQTRLMTPPDSNYIAAALDVANQVITGGARVTSNGAGTITTGTVTLDPGTRPLWDYTNNGAHTLAPGTNRGTIVLDITNGASAGIITISGWTKVVGTFDTTNAHVFRCFCSIGAGGSLLTIQAMF